MKPESAAQRYTRQAGEYTGPVVFLPSKHQWRPLIVKPHPEQARMDQYRTYKSLWA